jgi:hypothetical protein
MWALPKYVIAVFKTAAVGITMIDILFSWVSYAILNLYAIYTFQLDVELFEPHKRIS